MKLYGCSQMFCLVPAALPEIRQLYTCVVATNQHVSLVLKNKMYPDLLLDINNNRVILWTVMLGLIQSVQLDFGI